MLKSQKKWSRGYMGKAAKGNGVSFQDKRDVVGLGSSNGPTILWLY